MLPSVTKVTNVVDEVTVTASRGSSTNRACGTRGARRWLAPAGAAIALLIAAACGGNPVMVDRSTALDSPESAVDPIDTSSSEPAETGQVDREDAETATAGEIGTNGADGADNDAADVSGSADPTEAETVRSRGDRIADAADSISASDPEASLQDDSATSGGDAYESEAPPPCQAVLPLSPAPDATGVVVFDLSGEWAVYNYGELYVLDAAGDSAMVAGKPAVRNRDSFEFVVNQSMYIGSDSGDIRVLINNERTVACDVTFVDLPTITADAAAGSGY